MLQFQSESTHSANRRRVSASNLCVLLSFEVSAEKQSQI